MKVIDKQNPGADPVHMSFDAAQAALASGAYEAHQIEGECGPDQPAAQSPKPGTDPVDGKETVADGSPLTNLSDVGVSGVIAEGLPKEPTPPKSDVVAPAKLAAPVKSSTKA